jgi:hypothetical protein
VDRPLVSRYQIIDSWGTLVDEETVWFVRGMDTDLNRYRAALTASTRHSEWKLKAHTKYKHECARYYHARIFWEFSLFAEVVEHHFDKVIWPSTAPLSLMVRVAVPPLPPDGDYRSLIENALWTTIWDVYQTPTPSVKSEPTSIFIKDDQDMDEPGPEPQSSVPREVAEPCIEQNMDEPGPGPQPSVPQIEPWIGPTEDFIQLSHDLDEIENESEEEWVADSLLSHLGRRRDNSP